MAIEALAVLVPMRLAATTGTTFDTAWPIIAGATGGWCRDRVVRLGADRGREKQDLGALSIRLRAVSGYH
jgi:hypothetical protein